ncbi:hypothetical protein JCM11491_001122 [Sporobolomyces phaffii]
MFYETVSITGNQGQLGAATVLKQLSDVTNQGVEYRNAKFQLPPEIQEPFVTPICLGSVALDHFYRYDALGLHKHERKLLVPSKDLTLDVYLQRHGGPRELHANFWPATKHNLIAKAAQLTQSLTRIEVSRECINDQQVWIGRINHPSQ